MTSIPSGHEQTDQFLWGAKKLTMTTTTTTTTTTITRSFGPLPNSLAVLLLTI